MYWPYWLLLVAGLALIGARSRLLFSLQGWSSHRGGAPVVRRIVTLGMIVAGLWIVILAVVHFMSIAKTGR